MRTKKKRKEKKGPEEKEGSRRSILYSSNISTQDKRTPLEKLKLAQCAHNVVKNFMKYHKLLVSDERYLQDFFSRPGLNAHLDATPDKKHVYDVMLQYLIFSIVLTKQIRL